MKKGILRLYFFLLPIPLFASPPQGWTDDILQAMDEAEQTGKDILISFTGSDWCKWCKALEEEVFSSPVFRDYAGENLVLVYLDFPRGFELSEKQQQHNSILAILFGVKELPSVWLLSQDLSPLLQTGYRPGGGAEYIRHLEEDRSEFDPAMGEGYAAYLQNSIKSYIAGEE